jgi:hypothetical protein
MSRFKEFTGRLRGMVHRPPADVPPPPSKPFTWEAPLDGPAEEPRDPGLETIPVRPASRPPIAPRLKGEEGRAVHWRARADVASFETVYAEAGINPPAHGYGVDKVADMLDSAHLASRPRDVRATAALAALDAAKVPLRDLIDDAVLRHKALAAFEAAKALELQAVKTRSRSRIEALQEQVRVFLATRNGEIDTLNRAVHAARQQLAQLQARKQREEDRLLRVVTHFAAPRPTAPASLAGPVVPSPRGAVVAPALPADPALNPAGPPKPGSA